MSPLRPKFGESEQSPAGESISPAQGLRLSRSPHPYHQRYSPRRHHGQTNISQTSSNPKTSERIRSLTASRPQEHGCGEENCEEADSQKRRKSSTSLSDSATEADDESGGVLRGLPAPPPRLRKGIKEARGPGVWSPLLTPTYLDENERKFSVEWQSKRRDSLQSPPLSDEERSRMQVKFRKRRRAEFLRRISETVLLGSVGCIACGRESASLCRTWWRGNYRVWEWKSIQS